MDNNLEIIPIINRIDHPSADIESVKRQIENDLGLDPRDVILASGKEGIGIKEIFDAIINRIPEPKGKDSSPLKALNLDSCYDEFQRRNNLCQSF